MINNNQPDRNRLINGLLIIIAIGLLAASIYSVYLAWRTGLAQSRAETASRLMAIRTSPRSTETPGINAWVSWSLLNNSPTADVEARESLRQLVVPRGNERFPSEFEPLLNVLKQPPVATPNQIEFKSDTDLGGQFSGGDLEFRDVRFVQNENELLVLTARTNDFVQSGIEQYSATTSQHLIEIKNAWKANPRLPHFEQFPQLRSARVARLYVLNEDESLISLPIVDNTNPAKRDLILSEGDEFRKNPLSPSFVSNNFFFNFRYDEPLDTQSKFSGMYLDLGGLGLVATVTRPAVYDGKRCVMGADITFDVDWREFADNLSSNLVSDVVEVEQSDIGSWNPWSEFNRSVPSSSSDLRQATSQLAEREGASSTPTERKSVYLATTNDGDDIMAIQVNRSTWLLLLVASDEIKLPWAMMLLTSLVFLSLLWRIEWSRRGAVKAQESARGEMQEKQNLLDTMKVPLMVVDPNTDEVVFCNLAAQSIGMKQGIYFGRDVVASDEASQQQYRQTQTLGEEHRRAYGVPIRVRERGVEQTRHAIVRSVAITAPIESLKADQRHRLGILFLIDEGVDLASLLDQRIQDVRIDEKRRLAGLMNHGIDSLARMLRSQLDRRESWQQIDDGRPEFIRWLSNYLAERIQLQSWVLENWGGQPSSTERMMIDRTTFIKTVEQFNRILEIASADRGLREQLHWNNGVISASAGKLHLSEIVQVEIDWDDDSCFAVPREGVFGFLLSEAVVNAVRHGDPSTAITCSVIQNRPRGELVLTVRNSNQSASAFDENDKPFGGLAIMTELARLCGWSEPKFTTESGIFIVELTIPVLRRKTEWAGD